MAETAYSPDPAGSARSQDQKPEAAAWTADEAFRQARAMFNISGVGIGHRRLSRLVRAWRASAQADYDFGTYLLKGADPTADVAVWRVLQTACPHCGRQFKAHQGPCRRSLSAGDAE